MGNKVDILVSDPAQLATNKSSYYMTAEPHATDQAQRTPIYGNVNVLLTYRKGKPV